MPAAYREVIGKRAARWNCALSHSDRAVHVRCPIHEQTMKVQACALISKLIPHVDYDPVPLGCRDWRDRPLAIYAYNSTVEGSVGIRPNPSNIEVICDSCGIAEAEWQKQQD